MTDCDPAVYNYCPRWMLEDEADQLIRFVYDSFPEEHHGELYPLILEIANDWAEVYGSYVEHTNARGRVLFTDHWLGYVWKMYRQLMKIGALVPMDGSKRSRRKDGLPENPLRRVSPTKTLELVEAKLESGNIEEAKCLVRSIDD